MNNVFLLKDESGCVSGYLMQCETGMKYRSDNLKDEKAELILLLESDLCEIKPLSGTVEIVCQDLNAKVEGALVISSDNKILMSTGKDAFKRWQERQEKMYSKKHGIKSTEIQDRKIKTEAGKTADCSNYASEKKHAEKKVWPERRWPSPPCMQDGEYRDGQWRNLK